MFRIMVFVFLIVFLGGFLGVFESWKCVSYWDCFGDYIYCCSGYCWWFCNILCFWEEYCGLLGSFEEYCCKGKCMFILLFCEKFLKEKENIFSGLFIVLVVIFSVILVVVVVCFIRFYWNKLCVYCFDECVW